jgi:hypothetical protein
MNSLIHLPTETLLNHIFPQLNVPYLMYLCQVNEKFADICRDDNLWRSLVQRDFNFDIIPENLSTWRKTYLFCDNLLNNPITAIPYVEDALLQQRAGLNLIPFYQKLLLTYKSAIKHISTLMHFHPITFTVHELNLYDPITKTIKSRTSLNQVRILRKNENVWRYITPIEDQSIKMIPIMKVY